ncbi:MAG: hypothetical protein GEV11_09540 [Streptosporangiales bacterium]|nr:hypothetical protein [Streptosporangiales bacterium]
MAAAHDHNYYRTLIAVADDCPVDESVVPEDTRRGGKKGVASIHYDMLAGQPYRHTQEDVLFQTWLERQDEQPGSPDEIARLRDEFFAKPKPCLRTSPLGKRYGWGFAFDAEGRVALLPMESEEYRKLLDGGEVKVLKAMKTKR